MSFLIANKKGISHNHLSFFYFQCFLVSFEKFCSSFLYCLSPVSCFLYGFIFYETCRYPLTLSSQYVNMPLYFSKGPKVNMPWLPATLSGPLVAAGVVRVIFLEVPSQWQSGRNNFGRPNMTVFRCGYNEQILFLGLASPEAVLMGSWCPGFLQAVSASNAIIAWINPWGH